MTRFYTVLLTTAFISCSPRLNYLGSSYTPSQKVDVFVDASAIQKPFTIIGKSSVEILRLTAANFERLQEKAVRKAKEKGANAILFQDTYFVENENSIRTVSATDSIGKSFVSIHGGTINPVTSCRKDILYLRYH